MISSIQNQKVRDMLSLYTTYQIYGDIATLLDWDNETMMPVNAGSRRGELNAFILGKAHAVLTSRKFSDVVAKAADEANLNETEQAIVRESIRLIEESKKIPASWIEKMSEHKIRATHSWREAREKDDFSLFQKDLEKMYELVLEYTQYKGYKEHPYEALLDDYEIGLSMQTVDSIFDALIPATREILAHPKKREIANKLIDGTYKYPKDKQMEIATMLMHTVGLSSKDARIDTSAHPFSLDMHSCDIRITTSCKEHDPFYAITSTMHESGHGLYAKNVSPILVPTPLSNTSAMLGIHESQSRTWENFVGRSESFCAFLLPILQKHFPWLEASTSNDIYGILNEVKPSLIRTEADQVTYNMHIKLRYDLEKMLLKKEIHVNDIPSFWNEKMREYLGIEPKTNAQGVLQDIHWSIGSIGYFPTYTLGNVYSAQFMDTFLQDHPHFYNEVAKGDFSSLTTWLATNIHQYGILYPSTTLVEKVTGEKPTASYLIAYLKEIYMA